MNAPARLLIALAAAAAAAPSTAAADGLPTNGVDAAPVSAPGGSVEYVTRRAGRATLVVARERGSEQVVRRLRLPGPFTVPAVAYDGSAGGLSADGRTLVLIHPRSRFPNTTTRFAVLNAKRLRPRRVLRLRGDFSFDAISPQGGLMYLIQYVSRNPNQYVVRAYDLRARRLLSEPIVDPREASEPMNGAPVTRAASPDGRWAYTLYDSAEHPFIHALDTEGRRAVCIDLLSLDGRRRGIWGLRLAVGPGGSPLTVEAGSRVLASIDTETFSVTEPGARRPAAGRSVAGDGTPWLLAAAVGAALLLVVAVGWRRRAAPRSDSSLVLKRSQHVEPRRSAGRADGRQHARPRRHDRERDQRADGHRETQSLGAQGGGGERRQE